jgi:CBS domain-containing protein
MKVKEIMTPDAATCSTSDDLSTAAMRMWNQDCGVLPVTDDGRIRAVITDRDICMALLFRGERPAAITVGEVIGGHDLYSCSPEDDVLQALKTMHDRQIRRLPVLEDGRLRGLLSINDVVLAAREPAVARGLTPSDVIDALQGICAHSEVPVPV